MIKNYFKIAFRNLWRHKGFSLINIVGLAVGMTACLLIFLYVSFELSYDTFHDKADQIYRVVTDVKTPTELINSGITSAPMGPNLKNEFPEIVQQTRIVGGSAVLQKGEKKFQENGLLYADSTFFSVFSFQLVQGDAHTALVAPFSVVLSQTAAAKYFGEGNAVGQSLKVDGKEMATVTGVMKDLPANSHFKADIITSMSTMKKINPGLDEQWGNFGYSTYVVLAKNQDPARVQSRLPAFMQKHVGGMMKETKMTFTLFLEPLKDIYMVSKRESPEKGSISNVYIFSIVAIFILLIACINFINLTTARASERAKEVGIRKVVGAGRSQLTMQFLGESILLCLIAFALAIIFCSLALPVFNQLAGKVIAPHIFVHSGNLLALFVISLCIGVIAGLYPALVLSSFKPIRVLKGRYVSTAKGAFLRKGLVVMQFTISIVLIVGTIVVYRQLGYMQNQELGFKKEHMLAISFDRDADVQKNVEYIKHELASVPNVRSVTASSSLPASGNLNSAYTQIESKTSEMQAANMELYSIDYDFFKQFDIKVVAGRPFSRDFATDSTKAMIVNETAVKSFGYSSPQQAIGKKFSQWGREGTIVGVVKDFHFHSLHDEIKPLTMRIDPTSVGLFAVNISSKSIPATIAALENKWKQLAPNRPWNYFFIDQEFNKQYKSEEQFGKLFFYFAGLAIFISCLGLLGLVSYSTVQRTREIGIRKVLGASVNGIVGMLSKEFLQLVLVSLVVAFPLAWFAMHKWLQDFPYRIDISWWMFALAGSLAVIVALATVSFQSVRAALVNPVKSLRSE
jgi:putative ABC transport system permease protein